MTIQEILQGVHDWTNGKIVYDISAAHPDGQGNPTPYADLTAALGTDGANIPTALRKGGMSIKFVQSSDNKYVQYRLMLSSWSTDVDDWQSMNADKVPTVSKTWAELKAMRDGGKLAPGQWYRITDYATTTSQQDTQSAGHQFDIIVRADSPTVLNENACATRHEGDTYFQNAKLESWQLKYCLDNVTARFAWANTSTGKGVVYGMIDEFGNECGYDFKNIQFKRYKVTSLSSNTSLQGLYAGYRVIDTSGSQGSLYPSGGTVSTSDTVWRYTFDLSGADYSLSPRQYGCHGNNIAPCKLQDTIGNRERQWLNNITFGNTQSSSQCWGNKFLERCHSMSFGNECYANTFGQYCWNNTFGQNCYRNTFGQSCSGNTFGQNCCENTFGQSCQYNTFGQNCYRNTFGQYCWNNTFGQSCSGNTFGQYCGYNTFGQYCRYNTFGQSCGSNTFGQSCYYNSIDHAYPLDGEYGTNEVSDSVRHCKLISYEFNYEDGEEYGVTAWLCSPFDATVNLRMYVTDSEGDTITSYNQPVTLKANVPQYFETKGSSDNDPSVFHAEMSYEIAGKTVTLEGEYEW